MTIVQKHAQNFDTLLRAFHSGDAALVQCQRKSDGANVAMVCSVSFDGEAYQITPFAEMVNGNPFELYDPPGADDLTSRRDTA